MGSVHTKNNESLTSQLPKGDFSQEPHDGSCGCEPFDTFVEVAQDDNWWLVFVMGSGRVVKVKTLDNIEDVVDDVLRVSQNLTLFCDNASPKDVLSANGPVSAESSSPAGKAQKGGKVSRFVKRNDKFKSGKSVNSSQGLRRCQRKVLVVKFTTVDKLLSHGGQFNDGDVLKVSTFQQSDTHSGETGHVVGVPPVKTVQVKNLHGSEGEAMGEAEDDVGVEFPVDCSNLTVSYNDGEVIAVDSLSLKVGKGVVLGILGGNGAGKTSTLRTFGGVIPPSGGVLKIGGHLMSSRSGSELARRDLGYCPDTGGLVRQATIREHIGVALSLRGMENKWPEALDLVEKFGLSDVIDRQTGGFSHGMSRRFSVLLAVLTSKSVLILDEPFDGVDPLGVEATEDSIWAAAESGLTVIVSTHLLSLLSKVSDSICVMSSGKIIAEEDAEVFRSSEGEHYYETLLRSAKNSPQGFSEVTIQQAV